jgi:hypothetical protein
MMEPPMAKTLSPATSDQTLYFVKADFGRLGKAFVETDPDANSRLQVVADIFTGEIKNPLQILECNPVEGICRDVTEDIARDVYAHVHDRGEPCPAHLRDFLDLLLGVSSADHLDIATGNFNVTRAAHRIHQAAE